MSFVPRTVPALHFVAQIEANVDNPKLSDAEFREFIRDTLPIVAYIRPIPEHQAPSQPKEALP